MNSKNYSIENIDVTNTLNTDVITLSLGSTTIRVFTQGSTSEIYHAGEHVTAQRPLYVQLVQFWETWKQRGGNPFMGPMAGRYDSSVISQPGKKNIHGVFAGMPWEISDIQDNSVNEGYIELVLPASRWKAKLVDYYTFAAKAPVGSEEFNSIARLIKVVRRRYAEDRNVQIFTKELIEKIKDRGNRDTGRILDLVTYIVNLAFPGDLDLRRRLTMQQNADNITTLLDEVWMTNVSDTEFLDASGFHTYWNAMLEEIVNPPWGENVPEHYDDNLPDLRVRILDQGERLNRTIFIIPEGELRYGTANQIIYKDPETVGIPEVSIENWRQRGDKDHYPHTARTIRSGETSRIGFRAIIVTGQVVPNDVLDYIDEVNLALGR